MIDCREPSHTRRVGTEREGQQIRGPSTESVGAPPGSRGDDRNGWWPVADWQDREEQVDDEPEARVEVLWRPGCTYCSRLRRGLSRAGVATVERDIWADPSAAARVRRATGGHETVPTVVIGRRALVNPSVAQVVATVRTEFPDDPEPDAGTASGGCSRSVWLGAGWTAAALVVWLLLAVWRPTTTWHLAPVLLAAAWPWVVGQDVRTGDRRGAVPILSTGLAGFAVTCIATIGLAGADLLRGPTFGGLPGVVTEAVVSGAAATLLAVLVGLRRALQTAVARSAWVGDQRIAVSDDVVMMDGNAYFPARAIRPGVLTPSGTTSVCPWKGLARYYSVTVDGTEWPDAAWTYLRPFPLARRVKGRIAFWGGVEVREE